MYALTHALIHTGQQTLQDHALLIDGEQMVGITPQHTLDAGIRQINLAGAHLAPGFIDLQLNGCGGVMFNQSPTVETLERMHACNLDSGTTSFLPTFITADWEQVRLAIAATAAYRQQYSHSVLGLHLEGPFINPARKGIHPAARIQPLDAARVDELCQHAGTIAKITLAPEQVTPAHIARLHEAGILVAIGHSAASYDQAMAGFAAGIRFATHLYNAMTPTLNGREPGVVGAIYDAAISDSHSISAGIIADGYHVHWANVRLAKRILGERLCLVTDGTAASGAPEGFAEFDFCGARILIKNGRCEDEAGTLGGSSLTMLQGVANLVSKAGVPLPEALRMASTYPARVLGLNHSVGAIAPGMVANLVIFDEQWQQRGIVMNGKYCPASVQK